MGFADEFVADLKAIGAYEDPDPEVLDDLLERWRANYIPQGPGYPRDEIREEIILRLTYPVYRIALKFRTRNNADDVLSEALLALVECVNRWWDVWDDNEENNIRNYVEVSVKKRIKDFIDNDSVLAIPSRRVREKVSKGKEVEQLNAFRLDPDNEDEKESPAVPPDDSYDLLDFFRSRLSGRDMRVAELKIEGWAVKDIAIQLKVCMRTIYYSIENMEVAYLEWEGTHKGALCSPC